MLPKIDGLQICSHLHRYAPGSFIMIISALSQESDKIRAVITSYSIHYTKLYEAFCPYDNGDGDQCQNDAVKVGLVYRMEITAPS